VTEAGGGFRGDQVLAIPEGWEEKEDAERRFEAAEEVRLLYVAVTRAKEELVVARWPDRASKSPWRALDPWLEEHAERLELESRDPEPGRTLEASWAEEAERAVRLSGESLELMRAATYNHTSVTEMTKGMEEAPASTGRETLQAESSMAFRGFSWGNAVHGALAAAAGDPSPESLRAICRDLLVEQNRPVDDHGQPVELIELLALVEAVRGSEIWQRATESEHALTEIPFAASGVPDKDTPEPAIRDTRLRKGPPRRQLDLFGHEIEERRDDAEVSPEATEDLVRVLEGVIDLAFREGDGWVVGRQVDLYARAWERLTGEPVKERVLFYTAQGRLDIW
jgi:ATP-dependent exoDNAse (exonuclease V) beta subunit